MIKDGVLTDAGHAADKLSRGVAKLGLKEIKMRAAEIQDLLGDKVVLVTDVSLLSGVREELMRKLLRNMAQLQICALVGGDFVTSAMRLALYHGYNKLSVEIPAADEQGCRAAQLQLALAFVSLVSTALAVCVTHPP